MKDKSKIVLIVVILVVAALIAYICYGITKGKKNPIVSMEVSYIDADGNEKNGIVKIELYPDVAPQSVANFIALSNNGFYDELTFHRIEDFVIQGGDKEGTGSGSGRISYFNETYTIIKIENDKAICKKNITRDEQKEIAISELPEGVKEGTIIWHKDGKYQTGLQDYTYGIKGEFAANGVNNSLKFEKGVIGMARSDYSSYGMTEEGYNSASTQFFIVNTDDKSASNSLNQNYAPFGKVIEGYEYIEEITKLYVEKSEENSNNTEESNVEETDNQNNAEQTENGESTEDTQEKNVPKIKSIRVETFGANYGEPNAINVESTISTINQYQSTYQQLLQQQSQNNSDATINSEETAE